MYNNNELIKLVSDFKQELKDKVREQWLDTWLDTLLNAQKKVFENSIDTFAHNQLRRAKDNLSEKLGKEKVNYLLSKWVEIINNIVANLDVKLTQNQKLLITQNCIDYQKVYYSEIGSDRRVPVNSSSFEFQLNWERSSAFFKPVVSDSNEPHISFKLSGTADRSQSPLSYFNDKNTQVTGGHVTLLNENKGKDEKMSTSLSEANDVSRLLQIGEYIGMREYNYDALHLISRTINKLVEQGLKDQNMYQSHQQQPLKGGSSSS